jgi:hypothetical protein
LAILSQRAIPDIAILLIKENGEVITAKQIKGRLITAIILIFMVLIVLGGCSMSNYGKLKSNREVAEAFKTYQILPNHKYYYWGAPNRPVAIVGINENYELNLKLWVEIDPGSANFRKTIDLVSLQGMTNAYQPWGLDILDHAGNEVGVWYSAITAAAVRVNEDNQIVKLVPSRVVAIGDQK